MTTKTSSPTSDAAVHARGLVKTFGDVRAVDVTGIRRAVGEQALDGRGGGLVEGTVARHPVHVPPRDGGEPGDDSLQPGQQGRGAER